MREVVLKVSSVGKKLSSQGRVQVTFPDGKDYSLDASRIKAIYYLNGYYVVYETDNPEFYKQYTTQVPKLATNLSFSIKEKIEERCVTCHSLIEWDADEPYCPKCGSDFDGWNEIPVKLIEIDVEKRAELEEFASKLFEAKCKYVDELFRNIAGGHRPVNFRLTEIEARLYTCTVDGAGVVQDPVFIESYYDEIEQYEHKLSGRYAILRTYADGSLYVILSVEGEPKLDTLNELSKQLEEKKKKEKEEQRRREEERKKKEEEQRRKWSDREAVISEILSKLPEWADGAYIEEKAVWGEDADILILVFPAKRSKFDSGFYIGESWRSVPVDVPRRFLEPFGGKVITRSREIVEIKKAEKNGKYINLKIA